MCRGSQRAKGQEGWEGLEEDRDGIKEFLGRQETDWMSPFYYLMLKNLYLFKVSPPLVRSSAVGKGEGIFNQTLPVSTLLSFIFICLSSPSGTH